MITYIDEYRNAKIVQQLADKIQALSTKPMRIMEVCGGHTMSIRKNGLHTLVGPHIRLLSGPGCPVCVTAIEEIDRAIAFALLPDVIVCSFGDLFYVPGSHSNLAKVKAEGGDVRVVYSISDALAIARTHRDKKVIFVSIGFETTAPLSASAITQAVRENIDNFFVFALHKTMPRALEAIVKNENTQIDALMCPGHVSTVTGQEIYRFIVDKYNISCCIAGFEPVDIMSAIYVLVSLYENGQVDLVNAYPRVVRPEGNTKAQAVMSEVFEQSDAQWRGIGVIPGSGLAVKETYAAFDAQKVFPVSVPPAEELAECVCADILRGYKSPVDCRLFGKVCTPIDPKGACMVSSEGACAAWYKYGA